MRNGLSVTRRKCRPKIQVRFLTSRAIYSEFKAAVVKNDLYIQDVFHSLMQEFVSQSKAGTLRIKKAHE